MRSSGHGPASVSEVPTTLSGRGVEIGNLVVLAPLAVVPHKAMTAAEAIRSARHYANKLTGAPPAALEASVTVLGRPIADVPAWVVTFTARKPINARGVLVTHFSVVLNATTKTLVLGFVTK